MIKTIKFDKITGDFNVVEGSPNIFTLIDGLTKGFTPVKLLRTRRGKIHNN